MVGGEGFGRGYGRGFGGQGGGGGRGGYLLGFLLGEGLTASAAAPAAVPLRKPSPIGFHSFRLQVYYSPSSKNTARPETDDKPRSSVLRSGLALPVGQAIAFCGLSAHPQKRSRTAQAFHRLWWPIFGHGNRRQKPIVCPTAKEHTVGRAIGLCGPSASTASCQLCQVFHRLWWPIFGRPDRRPKPIVCATAVVHC